MVTYIRGRHQFPDNKHAQKSELCVTESIVINFTDIYTLVTDHEIKTVAYKGLNN